MQATIAISTFHQQRLQSAFRRIALSAIVVGLLAPLAVSSTIAAFDSTSSAEGNGFAAGTVYLSSDAGGGGSTLSMPNSGPGSTAVSYTTIDYAGTLPAGVRLYGTVAGTGLDRFLQVTVTRGAGEGPAFVPDATDYTGAGAGVVFRGTLAEFPTTWAAGIVDPATWNGPESHSFRFRVTLADDPAGMGLTAGADFHWEARNV